MFRLLLLCCVTCMYGQSSSAMRPESKAEDVAGTWQGVLETGVTKLRVAFHIRAGTDGQLSSTLDSIDQGARGFAATSTVLSGKTLTIEFKNLNGRFVGGVAAGQLAGTWEQGGNSLPLTLTPAVAPRRPQTPKPPFPYEEEQVSIPNEAGGNVLASTLTLPAKSPAAAVLLLTGSGPQDRDETLFAHKPFAVIADRLTRAGIAVLRVDDRGTGKSTGSFATATIHDFAMDAKAAFAYLRSNKAVDPQRTGMLGHSERRAAGDHAGEGDESRVSRAACFARRTAATTADPPGGDDDSRNRSPRGIDREKPESANGAVRHCANVAAGSPFREAEGRGRAVCEGAGNPRGRGHAADQGDDERMVSRFREADPLVYLKQVRCPVLALNGEKDMQVDAGANLRLIDAALKESGTPHEVRALRGLNHLFQAAQTGLLSEYDTIEQTMDEEVLKIVSGWIGERTRK